MSNTTLNATQPIDYIDHFSPWASVRLIQSHVIDLHNQSVKHAFSGRPVSAFDRTRSYFESNIFSDSALQELHAIDATPRPTSGRIVGENSNALKCFDLLILGNTYFVATNQGVLMTGTLSANCQYPARPIRVSAAPCVYPTCLQRASSDRNALLVGMSDGSVKLVWCPTYKSEIDSKRSDIPPSIRTEMDSGENVNISAKSCAIQNIIRDERRDSQESYQTAVDVRAEKPDLGTLDSMHFWNQTILLSCQLSRKHHVKWMGIGESTKRLLTLSGNVLRQFDLEDMVELAAISPTGILDAALASTGQERRILVK